MIKKVDQANQDDLKVKYEFFDVTADIGFWAFGRSLEEAYENAAVAMFDVISNVEKIATEQSRKIAIESEDLVSLLYDWLEELLFIHEVELMFFSKFEIAITKNSEVNNKGYRLEGVAIGEKIDWNIHNRGSEVKAVTFHMMKVITNDIFKVRVILDL